MLAALALPRHEAHCPARHQTYAALAGCVWDEAAEVSGEGPFALVIEHWAESGIRTLVMLWTWADDALDAKNLINATTVATIFRLPDNLIQLAVRD